MKKLLKSPWLELSVMRGVVLLSFAALMLIIKGAEKHSYRNGRLYLGMAPYLRWAIISLFSALWLVGKFPKPGSSR